MCSVAVAAALLLGGALPLLPTGTAGAAVRFPGIRIFPAEHRIECDAKFDIVDPSKFLEYLAVTPYGKLHESLFELPCEPDKLQLGLILCGLEPKPEVLYQGEMRELKGPRVVIEAEFGDAAGRTRCRVEDLMNDVRLGRPMELVGFAFTGSRFLHARGAALPDGERQASKELFAANESGSTIAVYHDPDSVLDNPLLTGGDVPLLAPTFKMVEVTGWIQGDERLVANGKLPAYGSAAVLHIRPARAADLQPRPR